MAAGFNEQLAKPDLSIIMDELEAGEAAVELDDKEPQEVLAWAIDQVRAGACDMLQLPGRRLRADRYGAQDRSEHPRLYDRHRPDAAGDLRRNRQVSQAIRNQD